MGDGGRADRVPRGHRWLGRLALASVVLGPLLAGTTGVTPSLFDDDLIRVGSLRRATVAESLLRPFNEHVAPLFELVGWGAWWASGRSTAGIAAAFRATGLAATLLITALLGALVRLELGSAGLAWLAAGLFAWQSATSEATLWYSATSFGWAAACALGAGIAAERAGVASNRRDRARWLAGAALLALAGPLFSAVGVLAGPLATLRVALARLDGRPAKRDRALGSPGWAAILTPLLGTLAFAALLGLSPGRSVVVGSVRARLDPGAGFWASLQAPTLVLGPALGGLDPLTGRVPDWVAVLATGAAGIAAGRLTWNRAHRAVLLIALGWVGGGYALTYLPRARSGDEWVFGVGRYHLFPMVGFILAIVTCLHGCPRPRWPNDRRLRAVGVVLGVGVLATLGGARFVPRWQAAAVGLRFPGQRASLAAALQLEAACRAEGVPLAQAIRVVPPTLPRWFPRPAGFHPLLYLFGPDGLNAGRPDDDAWARVRAQLSLDEREALFGGLDARQAGALAGFESVPGGRFDPLMATRHGSDSIPGAGLVHWADFRSTVGEGAIQALGLPVADEGADRLRVEVWWPDDEGGWTPRRSVVWHGQAGHRWLILGRIPQWTPGSRPAHFRLVRRNRPWLEASRSGGLASPMTLDMAHPGGRFAGD